VRKRIDLLPDFPDETVGTAQPPGSCITIRELINSDALGTRSQH
jgi:hypothetical protein